MSSSYRSNLGLLACGYKATPVAEVAAVADLRISNSLLTSKERYLNNVAVWDLSQPHFKYSQMTKSKRSLFLISFLEYKGEK